MELVTLSELNELAYRAYTGTSFGPEKRGKDIISSSEAELNQDHNHIIAGATEYTIGSLDRISGDYSALLLKDGKCVGATPLGKLEAVK